MLMVVGSGRPWPAARPAGRTSVWLSIHTGDGTTSAGIAGQTVGTEARNMNVGPALAFGVWIGSRDIAVRIAPSGAGHSAGSRNRVDTLRCWMAGDAPAAAGGATR